MDIGTIILVACFAVPAALGICIALVTQADIFQNTAREMRAIMHEHPSLADNGHGFDINPASGLPMVGDIDIAGNAWGANTSGIDEMMGDHHHH